ncbi:MAG TPA: diguanylate cyclase [Clostridia bacterium]|nr:diguanylate cyclase [Clostridia bacterium]
MQALSYLILIPLVSFLFYTVLLMILLGSRKSKIARYYTFYIVSMIIWSFGSFIMRTNFPPGALFWNRILCTGLISMPVVFYHFTLVLTETNNQKGKLYFGYASAFLLLICNFAGLIMKDAYAQNNVFYYTLGPLASVMAVWSLCYLLLAFINIIQKVRSNKIPFARVKYIMCGLTLVIIGGLLNLLPSLGKYPLDIASNTINALFIAYSIYRYRFLEIKLIVKKGIAYSVYTLILSGVYIIAIFGVQQVITSLMGYTTMTITLSIAVLLAMIFQPIKNVLQHWIDRIFYREKLSHQSILKDFSRIINNVLNLDELTDSLIYAVGQGMQPRIVSLVLRQSKDDYRLFRSSVQDVWTQDIKYTRNHPIVQWFTQGKPFLTIDDIESSPCFAGLWSMEKKQLYELKTQLIVPMWLREQLIGYLILSERKGGESYSQEEIDLLYTLVNNAAVVIENAKMYEEAKQQAITDGLTKLYNHRYFHEVLGQLIHDKIYKVFSVAMIDVDLFKLYNDLYGHSAGDKALARLAEVIREATRQEDIIARYGGEEFAVIFPNIEGYESLKAIDAIRKAVETNLFSDSGSNELLTISVGVANYPKDGKAAEELLECADGAMYTAKRSGRNQSVLYSKKDELNYGRGHNLETEKMQNSIRSSYFSAIYALAATIDAKDHYTYGHSENVSSYAVALAKAAGFGEGRIDIVKNAGLLHDIGKVGIPESILTKADKLTKEEFDIMKRHVDISISIIKHVPGLIKVIPAIMSHHERYDGKGYPRGIAGENIPIESRCLCIVDAFDAMTTDRPYRKALSVEQAIYELKLYSGTQFDPQLVEVFVKLIEEGKIEVA